MGLVVDLGLERFEPLDAMRILERLVADGYTRKVRDVFGGKVLEIAVGDDEAPSPRSKQKQPKPDEGPPRSRWLSDQEARPILRDIAKLAYAEFSWDELEQLGVWELQPLAVVRDGPAPSYALGIQLGRTNLKVIDLDQSAQSWRGTRGKDARRRPTNVGRAAKLHALAKQHRLIVHSQ